jgi:formate-dependent nitrite reductase membrane component NrfD
VFMDVPEPTAIRWVLLGGVAATAALIFIELTSHGSRHVELAVHEMTNGAYARQFWWGGIAIGLLAPAALVVIALAADVDGPALAAVAGVAALIGMFAYEDSFVRAGQSVPLS